MKKLTISGLVIACTLMIEGCSGGAASGAFAALSSKLSGTVIDSVVPNATVVITDNAPELANGSTLATISSDPTTGAYSVSSVTWPAASLPVFANASATVTTIGGATVKLDMVSYIGQSSTLASNSTFSSSTNLPNLDISPVTTAVLAVYSAVNGGNFSNITPTSYASTLTTYNSAVLALASGIKAMGDGYCAMPSIVGSTSTWDFANHYALQMYPSALTNGSAVSTVSSALTNCVAGWPGLAALSQVITSDRVFGPQLNLGEVVELSASGSQAVTTGSYQLQYVLADTGQTVNTSCTVVSSSRSCTGTTTPNQPFVPSTWPIVTIDSSGNITSTDSGNITTVAGSILGNYANVTLTVNGVTNPYVLNGKVSALPTTLYTSTSGIAVYALEASGSNNSSTTAAQLTQLYAVLVPWNGTATTATPVFTGLTSTTNNNGVTCPGTATPVRMDFTAAFTSLSATVTSPSPIVGGVAVDCLGSQSSTGFSWVAPSVQTTTNYSFGDDGFNSGTMAFAGGSWSQLATGSFVVGNSSGTTITLTAPIVAGGNSYSIQNPNVLYVLGTHAAVISAGSYGYNSSATNTIAQVNGFLRFENIFQNQEYASESSNGENNQQSLGSITGINRDSNGHFNH